MNTNESWIHDIRLQIGIVIAGLLGLGGAIVNRRGVHETSTINQMIARLTLAENRESRLTKRIEDMEREIAELRVLLITERDENAKLRIELESYKHDLTRTTTGDGLPRL